MGLKEIHDYHKKSNGWNGIGYSYFVPKNGGVQLGCDRNVGAHCKGMGMNNQSLGYASKVILINKYQPKHSIVVVQN
ncbi:hypothetical protein [Metabacillus fastidiosus]|uniref:hypothetical protein n=1 Tax=Metabacillus fastidiosus TaxID=1458 RepID=UPI003D2C623D